MELASESDVQSVSDFICEIVTVFFGIRSTFSYLFVRHSQMDKDGNRTWGY
jgi:hypothetical protein